jgi:predicted RNA methylase
MRACMRIVIGIFAIGALTLGAYAHQAPTPQLNKVMRAKLAHSQAILAAVVTSNWAVLDRESRALALAVREPAWGATLTEPEYLRQSDAFSRALQDLIEASAKRNLESAAEAHIALTASCVRCHAHMTRRRIAK